MTRAMRLIGDTAYWLGLVGLLVSILLRFMPGLAERATLSPRGGLILASCLFLCTLASREMGKTV